MVDGADAQTDSTSFFSHVPGLNLNTLVNLATRHRHPQAIHVPPSCATRLRIVQNGLTHEAQFTRHPVLRTVVSKMLPSFGACTAEHNGDSFVQSAPEGIPPSCRG